MTTTAPSTPGVQLLEVSPEYAGQRIDNFLLARLKGVPKTLIYRILRKGEVRVNKGRIKPEYKLQAGDIVRVPPVRVPERDEPVPLAQGLLLVLGLDPTFVHAHFALAQNAVNQGLGHAFKPSEKEVINTLAGIFRRDLQQLYGWGRRGCSRHGADDNNFLWN